MTFTIKKLLAAKNLIIFFAIILVAINGFYLFVYIMSKHTKDWHELEPGLQFAEFKTYLKGISDIGYITNKDISPEKNDGAFLQAQYFLAPVVIHLDKTFEYNIIDSTDAPYLISTMKLLRSPRIANNEYGQALIRRKP